MKKLQTIISMGVLAASSVLCPIIARAQNVTTLETSQGTLGKRYAALDFAVGDPTQTSDNVYGTSLGINVPMTSYLDISASYAYSWYKTDYAQMFAYKSDSHSLGADFIFYKAMSSGLKPFLSAGLAYSWNRTKFQNRSAWVPMGEFELKGNSTTWGAAIGIEIPFRWVALTPSIGLSGDVEDTDGQTWNCALEASSWITRKMGVFAGIAYSEPTSSNVGDAHMWAYGAGLRIKL